MKNSFFKELAMIGPGFQVTMTFKEKHGQLTVSVVPNGLDNVQPIIATGTPEELDEGFFEAIRKPLQEARGVIVHNAAFEESLKNAKKTEPEKKTPSTPAKKSTAAKKSPASKKEAPAKKAAVAKSTPLTEKPEAPPASTAPKPVQIFE